MNSFQERGEGGLGGGGRGVGGGGRGVWNASWSKNKSFVIRHLKESGLPSGTLTYGWPKFKVLSRLILAIARSSIRWTSMVDTRISYTGYHPQEFQVMSI